MNGPFSFTKQLINITPNVCGLYYLRAATEQGLPGEVVYVGSAGVDELSDKLMGHLINDQWEDVAYFEYREYESPLLATVLEMLAMTYYNPKYNKTQTRMPQALT